MNMGLHIDTLGVVALAALLFALPALSQMAPSRQRLGFWIVLLAGLLLLGGQLLAAGEVPAILVLAMLLLGGASAPWAARRAPGASRAGVLPALTRVTTGLGLAIALLGLTGWFENDDSVYTWDLRLVAVLGVFIGIWTFAAGLVLWLRLGNALPQSEASARQKWVVLGLLLLSLILGALAVRYPATASVLLIVLGLLALEMGALLALGLPMLRATRLLEWHLALIGLAIGSLGYVQSSLFLLALGSMMAAMALRHLRAEPR
ncbi:hypothetical protein [Halothiobacillus sp. DCM-1]|uniref:hypothetical protein n=1 Tax=Halothiobacillus sp. DCM-1 TaxID=3112558 RepID=UPI00324ED8D0